MDQSVAVLGSTSYFERKRWTLCEQKSRYSVIRFSLSLVWQIWPFWRGPGFECSHTPFRILLTSDILHTARRRCTELTKDGSGVEERKTIHECSAKIAGEDGWLGTLHYTFQLITMKYIARRWAFFFIRLALLWWFGANCYSFYFYSFEMLIIYYILSLHEYQYSLTQKPWMNTKSNYGLIMKERERSLINSFQSGANC